MAADVLSLALLPAKLGDIIQEIEQIAPDTFTARNTVTFAPPLIAPLSDSFPSVEYTVEAACKPISSTKLTLLFVGVTSSLSNGPVSLPAIGGRLPTGITQMLQAVVGERIYLETTYLDEDLRIARGPGRELYILSKRELE